MLSMRDHFETMAGCLELQEVEDYLNHLMNDVFFDEEAGKMEHV